MNGDEDLFELYQKGVQLIDGGNYHAAIIPLEKAKEMDSDKTSIREGLGRAYFKAGRYDEARLEFVSVLEHYPVNDFAHFCLGRCYEKLQRIDEARHHLSLAASLRPDRNDYKLYRERLENNELG